MVLPSRGRTDPENSKDWTDIVSVLDGRPELLSEVRGSPSVLQTYLADQAVRLLQEVHLGDWLSAALLPDRVSQARATLVRAQLTRLADLR